MSARGSSGPFSRSGRSVESGWKPHTKARRRNKPSTKGVGPSDAHPSFFFFASSRLCVRLVPNQAEPSANSGQVRPIAEQAGTSICCTIADQRASHGARDGGLTVELGIPQSAPVFAKLSHRRRPQLRGRGMHPWTSVTPRPGNLPDLFVLDQNVDRPPPIDRLPIP